MPWTGRSTSGASLAGFAPVSVNFERGKNAMRFHANYVSASVSGDYYQAMFKAMEN